jgi:hypothetical protein
MRVSSFLQNFWPKFTISFSIVEFASQEDSQRAIRELSEQPLLGRPVFIREVRIVLLLFCSVILNMRHRIVKTKHDSEPLQYRVKWGWRWLAWGSMPLRHRDLLHITTLAAAAILVTNSMLETCVFHISAI